MLDKVLPSLWTFALIDTLFFSGTCSIFIPLLSSNFLCYTQIGDLPRKEVHHMYEIVTKILVPIFVGIVLKLVTIWLEKQNEE